MTILRRNLFRLWLLCCVLWLAFVVEVFDHEGQPDNEISVAAIFLLPPMILFLAGWGLMRIYERFGEPHWLRLPQHLRRGLTRLYVVVAAPWVAWYGYQIYYALERHRYELSRELSHAFWSLLIVPVGGPILFAMIFWVVTGFQKSGWRNEKPKHNQTPDGSQSASPAPLKPEDYFTLIERVVSTLQTNDRLNRIKVYDRARAALRNELHGQDRSRIKHERKALEEAIREIETDAAAQQRTQQKVEPASTVLLIFSIFFPGIWVIDFTSMSLYWVARLPRLR